MLAALVFPVKGYPGNPRTQDESLTNYRYPKSCDPVVNIDHGTAFPSDTCDCLRNAAHFRSRRCNVDMIVRMILGLLDDG